MIGKDRIMIFDKTGGYTSFRPGSLHEALHRLYGRTLPVGNYGWLWWSFEHRNAGIYQQFRGTGFTVFNVNTDGTLTMASISPQTTPAAPKMLQFSANGKWAYFLDAAGANIYAYTRAGNGTLATPID